MEDLMLTFVPQRVARRKRWKSKQALPRPSVVSLGVRDAIRLVRLVDRSIFDASVCKQETWPGGRRELT